MVKLQIQPNLLALFKNPTALPSLPGVVGFCTKQQVLVFELSQSAVGFHIIVPLRKYFEFRDEKIAWLKVFTARLLWVAEETGR